MATPTLIPVLNLATLHHRLAISKCHLAFFGASVTQQGAGYVCSLSKRLAGEVAFSDFECSQLGFGSLHLPDAVQLLPETLLQLHAKKPVQLCFLQWLTGSAFASQAELAQLVVTLLRKNILPVLLLFYNHDERKLRASGREVFYQVARDFVLPLLDLDSYVEANPSLYQPEYFRDNTHLTLAGSELMAGFIYQELFAPFQATYLPQLALASLKQPRFVPFIRSYLVTTGERQYLPLYKAAGHPCLAQQAQEIRQGETIKLPSSPAGFLVGLWVITGPESGIVRIRSKDGLEETLNIWDQWSHYDRFTIRRFSREWHTSAELSLELTELDPDYSTCRRPVERSQLPPKKLWLLGWSLVEAPPPPPSLTPPSEPLLEPLLPQLQDDEEKVVIIQRKDVTLDTSRTEQMVNKDERVVSKGEQMLSKDEGKERTEQMVKKEEEVVSKREGKERGEEVVSKGEQMVKKGEEEVVSKGEEKERGEEVVSKGEGKERVVERELPEIPDLANCLFDEEPVRLHLDTES